MNTGEKMNYRNNDYFFHVLSIMFFCAAQKQMFSAMFTLLFSIQCQQTVSNSCSNPNRTNCPVSLYEDFI